MDNMSGASFSRHESNDLSFLWWRKNLIYFHFVHLLNFLPGVLCIRELSSVLFNTPNVVVVSLTSTRVSGQHCMRTAFSKPCSCSLQYKYLQPNFNASSQWKDRNKAQQMLSHLQQHK